MLNINVKLMSMSMSMSIPMSMSMPNTNAKLMPMSSVLLQSSFFWTNRAHKKRNQLTEAVEDVQDTHYHVA